MTKATGNSWQIIFAPLNGDNDKLCDFLEDYFEVMACNYTEDERVEYVGYCAVPIDEAALKNAATAAGVVLPSYRVEFVPAANWLTKNVIKFPPLITEHFCIYGIHEEKVPAPEKLALKIYAATAFGSGQHQTTRCCLQLLEKLNDRGITADKILDMGCGSGILALSALKLWKNAIAVAADIDDEAVIVALQNAADNDLTARISAAAGDGYHNDIVLQNAPYQLIFSNILARPLIEMAPSLAAALAPGGHAILSGFIDEQTDWVLEAHHSCGLRETEIIGIENWRAALMEKEK